MVTYFNFMSGMYAREVGLSHTLVRKGYIVVLWFSWVSFRSVIIISWFLLKILMLQKLIIWYLDFYGRIVSA